MNLPDSFEFQLVDEARLRPAVKGKFPQSGPRSCPKMVLWLVGFLVLAGCFAGQGHAQQADDAGAQTEIQDRAAGEVEENQASALPPAEPYLRVQRGTNGLVTLQIALRQFVPRHDGGTEIWLVGVSHVGETNYYRKLESFLNRQSLVLFEGVGFDKEEYRRRQRLLQSGGAEGGELGSLQTVLAQSLGLAFQLDTVDYDQDHFRNSDLGFEELQALMMRQVREGALDDTMQSNPEFLALIAAMEGSSWLGKFLHMGVRLMGSNPKLRAMSRLMLIEVSGNLRGDMSRMQGLPPDLQELLEVLIRARNDVVISDVQKAIGQTPAPESIAIFYGAAHMDDLEMRLRRELGYRAGEEQWMDALWVNPAQAGLGAAEIQMIRGLVDWQMKMLSPQ